MKLIFLDIDGPLNSRDYMNACHSIHRLNIYNEAGSIIQWYAEQADEVQDVYGQHFDPRCVKWLKYIIEKTDAKIVISSSWRNQMHTEDFIQMWKDRNLPGLVIDVTPLVASNETKNKYPRFHEREREIQEFLDNFDGHVEKYVAIDDFPMENINSVYVTNQFGLDYNSTQKIIKLLSDDE